MNHPRKTLQAERTSTRLTGEYHLRTEDPEYERLGDLATKTCTRVDEKYVQRFLSDVASMRDTVRSI